MMNKRKKERPKKKFPIPSFLLFFVLILLSVPFISFAVDSFAKLQISKFSSENRLIFIHSVDTLKFLVLIPIALVFCLLIIIYDDDRHKKSLFFKNPIHLAITIFIVGSLLVWNDFYHYTHIDKHKIVTRKGIFTKEVRHNLEEIDYVTVDYNLEPKDRVDIFYNLHLAQNQVINLKDSSEFFTHIVNADTHLTNRGIPIHRKEIAQSDYDIFEKNYEGPGKFVGINRLEVLEEVFE